MLKCNQIVEKATGTVKSYNYPLKYRNNMYCAYSFYRSSLDTCCLKLTFTNFSVQLSDGCTKDFLKVGEKRLCGNLSNNYTVEECFERRKDTLSIHFVTDGFVTGRGFQVEYRLVKCDEPITMTTEKHSISGPVKFNCPFKNGLFPHERLCRKYYDCKNNIAVLKECPSGKLFKEEVVENERFADCEDEDTVNCKELLVYFFCYSEAKANTSEHQVVFKLRSKPLVFFSRFNHFSSVRKRGNQLILGHNRCWRIIVTL
ncbi:CUB domain-containing protein 2-like [Tachypleus tridentatus]|uniref:CUB domain-containing protein 2-like n=1 Tax=Tachypleus tridentatus TaxID=6853 RepID=UPI003FD5E050